MGAQNVSKVFTLWRRLPDQPFRALTFMALVSMDADNPPKYWGGRDAIAQGLGHSLPAKADDSAEAEDVRTRAHRSVKRALRVLQAEGAIATVKPAVFGSNAVYEIRVSPLVDNSPQGTTQETPKGAEKETPKGAPEETPKGVTPLSVGGAFVAPWGPQKGPHRSTRNKEDQSKGSSARTKPTPSPPSPPGVGKLLIDSFPSTGSKTQADIEAERNRQLNGLEKLISSQKEAS